MIPRPNNSFRYAVSTRWERDCAEHNGTTKDFHRFFCCLARRLGNMFVLCERHDGSPVVIAGPCWPFCCFVTVPLILGITGAVAYFVIISEDSPLVGRNERKREREREMKMCRSENVSLLYLVSYTRFDLDFVAHLGSLCLLSSRGSRAGILVLCQLSRSGPDGTSDRRRSGRRRLVLERASGEFPTTGCLVLSRVWGTDTRL